MANQTGKRNKFAGRSLVVCGTLLAGTAIWMSVAGSAKPPAQTAAPVSDNAISSAPSTIINSDVASTLQTPIPAATAKPQTVVPRFRTRGS
jgi:hypothetical protein